MEEGIEKIVRARTWDVLKNRCGDSVLDAGETMSRSNGGTELAAAGTHAAGAQGRGGERVGRGNMPEATTAANADDGFDMGANRISTTSASGLGRQEECEIALERWRRRVQDRP